MPFIPATMQSLLTAALQNKNATASSYASQFASALMAAASSAFINTPPTPIPMAGVCLQPIVQTQIMAVASNPNGNANSTASQYASAISSFCPLVPPVGMAVLQMQLANIFSNSNNTENGAASQIANAIATYFSSSGMVI